MENYTAPNVGKICRIEVINPTHIDRIIVDREKHKAHITLEQGKSFTDIVFTEETAELQVTNDDEDDGSLPPKQLTLNFEVPQITRQRVANLESWKRQTLLCRIHDVTGRAFLIGTHQAPAVMLYNYGIGKKSSDPNTHNVTITAFSPIGLVEAAVG